MQFIKPDINIDIIGKRKIGFIVSAGFILLSIVSLIIHGGPKYGIDFSGGTVIQVKFESQVSIDKIKTGLAEMNIDKPSIQAFGDTKDHEYLIRTDMSEITEQGFSKKIQESLTNAAGSNAEVRRVEMVGPQVGQDLREKALFAMFYALLFITIYISGRFELKWLLSGVVAAALMGSVYILSLLNMSIPFLIFSALIVSLVLFWFLEFKYAMGAIVALIHDIIITVGIFSLFGKEFSLPIIAALLTIIGYSLNDTIIVFDRIRENLRKYSKNPLEVIINKSINETLSRTILTSTTTLIVVIALFVLGGGIIHDFAFALIVGVFIGTYSSIYVASPILLAWQEFGRKKS
ncbi:Protein translocase, subunit F [Desulfonema limicola]|uniref:Protein-export membrane protein SecF n=1 Tax=Desulfonema limicola TaxID=45656 RepID=A0A975BBP4_9BACT|nr:protein translocase subunit SecF [Desulfonema limicola]QTA82426.1 Protein translocase, subunit F [Desulfonema limicola]